MCKVIVLTEQELQVVFDALEDYSYVLAGALTDNMTTKEKYRDCATSQQKVKAAFTAQPGVVLPLDEAVALVECANDKYSLMAIKRIRAAQAATAGGETADRRTYLDR